MYEDQTTGKVAKHLANRAGAFVSRMAALIGKKVALNIGKWVIALLIKTAPVWVPFVLILLLVLGAYMLVYGIPKSAAEDGFATGQDKVGAFFGFSHSNEFIEQNKDLFKKYEKIAAQWDDDLSEEQRAQVEMHAFSWALLLAVDRLIHDPTVTKEKDIQIKPDAVYEDLRPIFTWKDSTITIVTTVCDDSGCTTFTEVIPVKLVTKAETVEGTFTYHYKWVTEGSGNSSITKEVLDYIEYPEVYYEPFFRYLNQKGIVHDLDIELVIELARIYDPVYGVNFALVKNFDYTNYPVLIGENNWQWVTPSTRITSSFGHRTSPTPSFHKGIDIGAVNRGSSGDPVYAMESGRVKKAISWCREGNRSCGGRYGNIIYLDHGEGIETRYAHLSAVYVRDGDWVERGTLIGLMGNTGDSYGTHLHFEIRKDDVPLDPSYYFNLNMEEKRQDGTYQYAGVYEITAYTSGEESTGKRPGDPGYGKTASGTKVTNNRTIAADWLILPVGTKVRIEGLPYLFVVEDKGSAIQGKKLDIFMSELDQAKSWGRQMRKVWILKE